MSKPPNGNDSTPAASTTDLLERMIAQVERNNSLNTQTLIEIRRAARMREASLQLDAREKMALRDTLERVERAMRRAQSPSLTVVSDVAIEATRARSDEISVVNLRLPWRRELVPIPNRWVRYAVFSIASFVTGGGVVRILHWIGWFGK